MSRVQAFRESRGNAVAVLAGLARGTQQSAHPSFATYACATLATAPGVSLGVDAALLGATSRLAVWALVVHASPVVAVLSLVLTLAVSAGGGGSTHHFAATAAVPNVRVEVGARVTACADAVPSWADALATLASNASVRGAPIALVVAGAAVEKVRLEINADIRVVCTVGALRQRRLAGDSLARESPPSVGGPGWR